MLSINTNLTALMVQRNLKKATECLNTAIKQLTTGYKLNHAKDNPANYAMAKQLDVKLSAWNTAADNISMGNDMLETASSSADLIGKHISRIRDLCVQSSNGTYGDSSIKAIKAEISERIDEIRRIKASTEFNGIQIFGNENSDGSTSSRKFNIMAGINSSEDSIISVETTLSLQKLEELENFDITDSRVLDLTDELYDEITDYQVKIGASQNRLEYALEYTEIMSNNISSSLSTIRDADIAKVSSDFIRYQILQQACITLLSTANQMPALALQLI